MKSLLVLMLCVLFIDINTLRYEIKYEGHIFTMPENPLKYFEKYFIDENSKLLSEPLFQHALTKLYQSNARSVQEKPMFKEMAEDFMKDNQERKPRYTKQQIGSYIKLKTFEYYSKSWFKRMYETIIDFDKIFDFQDTEYNNDIMANPVKYGIVYDNYKVINLEIIYFEQTRGEDTFFHETVNTKAQLTKKLKQEKDTTSDDYKHLIKEIEFNEKILIDVKEEIEQDAQFEALRQEALEAIKIDL